MSARLRTVEDQLEASRRGISPQNLEIDTAERIISSVEARTKRFLFFVSIPATIAGLALAIIWGKGAWTLSDFATRARDSVGAVLAQAQSVAARANDTAHDALRTSKQVESQIEATREEITTLKKEIGGRSADVQRLNRELQDAQSKVDALEKQVGTGSQQVKKLFADFQEVKAAKTQTDIETYYPIYGTHVARSRAALIDPAKKPPGAVYVSITLSLTTTPNVGSKQVAEGIEALHGSYTVMLGPIYVEALTAHNAQPVGMGLDSYSCTSWIKPPSQAPCIIYFQGSMRKSALEVRDALKVAQVVPDSQVIFADPTNLNADQKETLALSGIDIAVVLGKQ
ncbi:MAG: hypothetical protein WCC97_08520 [Candidatus Acidiferrales bacterium]